MKGVLDRGQRLGVIGRSCAGFALGLTEDATDCVTRQETGDLAQGLTVRR
jgi:hypothetical protein